MKRNRFDVRALLLQVAVCLFAIAAPALAQDTSSLSGTVTDASGALLPNVRVTVHSDATNADRVITTNEIGGFTITNLAPGNYDIRAELAGFQTSTLTAVHVDPSIGRRVDITMRVGDTRTEISVEAGANTVQTESGAVGQLVTRGSGQVYPAQWPQPALPRADGTRRRTQQFDGGPWLWP